MRCQFSQVWGKLQAARCGNVQRHTAATAAGGMVDDDEAQQRVQHANRRYRGACDSLWLDAADEGLPNGARGSGWVENNWLAVYQDDGGERVLRRWWWWWLFRRGWRWRTHMHTHMGGRMDCQSSVEVDFVG